MIAKIKSIKWNSLTFHKALALHNKIIIISLINCSLYYFINRIQFVSFSQHGTSASSKHTFCNFSVGKNSISSYPDPIYVVLFESIYHTTLIQQNQLILSKRLIHDRNFKVMKWILWLSLVKWKMMIQTILGCTCDLLYTIAKNIVDQKWYLMYCTIKVLTLLTPMKQILSC